MLAGRRERSKAAKAQADEAEIRANLANKLLEEQWEEYYALKRRYRALEETRSKENEIEQAEEGIRTMRKEIRMVLDGGDGGRQREFETAADRTAVGRTEHSQDASDQEEAVTVYVERRGPVRIREPKSQKHGEWSEKSAREVLRGFMERPLIQAVLNYFESFLTMDMLEELGELLHEDPAACENLDALRERLGRRSKRLLRGVRGLDHAEIPSQDLQLEPIPAKWLPPPQLRRAGNIRHVARCGRVSEEVQAGAVRLRSSFAEPGGRL